MYTSCIESCYLKLIPNFSLTSLINNDESSHLQITSCLKSEKSIIVRPRNIEALTSTDYECENISSSYFKEKL